MIDQIFHQRILMRLMGTRIPYPQLSPVNMRQTTPDISIALHKEFCGVPRLPETFISLFPPLRLDHVGIRFGQCRGYWAVFHNDPLGYDPLVVVPQLGSLMQNNCRRFGGVGRYNSGTCRESFLRLISRIRLKPKGHHGFVLIDHDALVVDLQQNLERILVKVEHDLSRCHLEGGGWWRREGALQFSDGYFLDQAAGAGIAYVVLPVIDFFGFCIAAHGGTSFEGGHCSFYFACVLVSSRLLLAHLSRSSSANFDFGEVCRHQLSTTMLRQFDGLKDG